MKCIYSHNINTTYTLYINVHMYTTHTTCICMYIHFAGFSEGWDVDGLVKILNF